MRKNEKDYTLFYSLFPSLTWGGFAVVLVYSLNWFEDRGIGAAAFGIITAAIYAFSLLCQILLGELITKKPAFTLKRCVLALSVTALCAGTALSFFEIRSDAVAVSLFSVIVSCVVIYPSLSNSVGMAAPYCGYKVNYGTARGIGAVAFAGLSFLTGRLTAAFGAQVVPKAYTVLSAVYIITALTFPDVRMKPGERGTRGFSPWRNPRFVLMLAGSAFIYIGQNLLSTYMLKIVQNIGYGADTQGAVVAISSVCELPAMFLFARLLKKGRCDVWVKVSAAFMLLRIAGCMIAPDVISLYLVQLFALMGYGLYCVASAAYVNKVAGEDNAVRAQSMLSATSSLGSFLVYAFGGPLLGIFGLSALTLFGVSVVAAGTLIFFLCLEKTGQT